MSLRVLAFLAALSGCAVGGMSRVGPFRARDRVTYDACLENDRGECIEHKRVIEHDPARRFWGINGVASVGPSWVHMHGTTVPTGRFEPGVEVLRGMGRLALGLRAQVAADMFRDGDVHGVMSPSGTHISLPVTGIAHLGLAGWFEVYGGLGVSPFNREFHRGESSQISVLGARGLAGMKFQLARSAWANPYFGVEADRIYSQFSDTHRASSLTFCFGVDIE